MATPRNLDPKFKDENVENVPQDDVTQDETPETVQDDAPDHDDTPMLVARFQVPDGQGGVKMIEHGPMPTADWPAYEKEHKL